MYKISATRIREISEVPAPASLKVRLPASLTMQKTVSKARQAIRSMLSGADDRLLVVIGPCSIHDPDSALEYAGRLSRQRALHLGELEIVMRTYLEKPRSTVGWKGLLNDPDLDGSFHIAKGLKLAREILGEINELELPVACEFLDPVAPNYLSDLVSWAAIGARTTESQVHREMASGLPCPVGFKNGTDGNISIAIDAIRAAAASHHFLGATDGRAGVVVTDGNPDCHLILRGGKEPNFYSRDVSQAAAKLRSVGLQDRLMIDFSHGNSSKNPEKQKDVCEDVAQQIMGGEDRIMGVMIESHLYPGKQEIVSGEELAYGVSVTDGCLGWEDSVALLDKLAAAVRQRRLAEITQPA